MFLCLVSCFAGPLDLLMLAMALLVGIPLSRLWWYHVQTILGKGQTTNEDVRGTAVLRYTVIRYYYDTP